MTEVTWTFGISAATLVAMGIAYGDIRARLTRIERAVFNGDFVGKKEIEVRVEEALRDRLELRRRIEQLEREQR